MGEGEERLRDRREMSRPQAERNPAAGGYDSGWTWRIFFSPVSLLEHQVVSTPMSISPGVSPASTVDY